MKIEYSGDVTWHLSFLDLKSKENSDRSEDYIPPVFKDNMCAAMRQVNFSNSIHQKNSWKWKFCDAVPLLHNYVNDKGVEGIL